jgi:DNA polymerase (family 10)
MRCAFHNGKGKAKELPGIGKTIENKVIEVVNDGEMHALTKRRGLVPAGVVDFLRLPGVGPKTAARFWTQLGLTTLDGLKSAAQDGRLRDLSGMGARSEEKIRNALEAGAGVEVEPRRLLGTALPAVRRVVTSSRHTPLRSQSPKRAASAVGARPSATSTSSRPRAMPCADRGVLRREMGL